MIALTVVEVSFGGVPQLSILSGAGVVVWRSRLQILNLEDLESAQAVHLEQGASTDLHHDVTELNKCRSLHLVVVSVQELLLQWCFVFSLSEGFEGDLVDPRVFKVQNVEVVKALLGEEVAAVPKVNASQKVLFLMKVHVEGAR